MWHKMIDGWQCCEGFGCRTAFPEDGDPSQDVIGFLPNGSLRIVGGGPREVPATVLAWLAAPFGSERVDQALSELRARPEESPLKIAILGVKRQPGEPEPIHITTREEYLAAFPGSSPPRSLFETETVTVIEVQDVETAAAAPWPVPYPLEKPGPETVLLEDAIDRSTWGTPGIDHLPSPHPIARIDIAPPISPLYFGDDYPRLARRKA